MEAVEGRAGYAIYELLSLRLDVLQRAEAEETARTKPLTRTERLAWRFMQWKTGARLFLLAHKGIKHLPYALGFFVLAASLWRIFGE